MTLYRPATQVLWIAALSVATTIGAAKPHRIRIGKIAPPTLKVGKRGTVSIPVQVDKGFHVQANPSSPPLIATNIKFDASPELNIFPAEYPKGKVYQVKGLPKAIQTYEGTFSLKVPVEPTGNTKPGKYDVSGEIRYQACDATVCYPPTRLPVKFSVTVAGK